MNKISIFAFVFCLALAAISCDPSKKVSRVDDKQEIDLSGRWNDVDSRLVSEEMVKDGLSRVWLTEKQKQ